MKLEGIILKDRVVAYEVLFSGFNEFKGLAIDNEVFFSASHTEADYRVFESHLTALWRFYEAGELPAPYRFFVNLKPRTLIDRWQDIYRLTSCFPFPVVLELREDAMSSYEQEELKKLKSAYRFSICLDDFGRGASNLDRAAELKPEFIKLDLQVLKSFPLSALYVLVHGLNEALPNTKLVAEKVETLEDYNLVRKLGIEMAQGFYFNEVKVLEVSYGELRRRPG